MKEAEDDQELAGFEAAGDAPAGAAPDAGPAPRDERTAGPTPVSDAERLAVMEAVWRGAPTFLHVLRGPEFVFELANPAYEVLVGRRDLVGRPAFEVLPEAVAGGYPERIARVMATREPFVGRELPVALVRTPGGAPEERLIDLTYLPLLAPDGTCDRVLGHGTDVTEQVRARRAAEAALQAREAQHAYLLRLSDALRSLADPAEVQTVACRVLGEQLGADRVSYAEVEGEEYVIAHEYRVPGLASMAGRYAVASYRPSERAAFAAGRTVAVADILAEPGLTAAEATAYGALGVRAFVSVPLVKAGHLLVVLGVIRSRPGAWTADEVTLIEETAERTWAAVVRSRAEAERERLLVEAEAARGALAERESKLRLALAAADLGAWDLDLATGRAWRSPRHDAILGYDAPLADWTYAQFLAHVVPEDRGCVEARFGGALAAGEPWDFTCRIRRADGAVRWVAARGMPMRDAAGTPTRLVGVVQDVTTAREAEAALRAALAAADAARVEAERERVRAAEANRAKGEFLAVMSHELRTPLNAIGGYAELLELGIRGPVTEAQRADLARIQQSQQHLLGLINEVLNYARLESGTVAYATADVPVAPALAAAEGLLAPQARAKGLTLAAPRCPANAVARADPDKLRQVLLNLLSNAVKFTDRGGAIDLSGEVVVVGGAAAQGGGGDGDPARRWVAIRVRDTGIGIPADKLTAVFEPFVQVRSDLTRPHEGTGLGLAISRDLARGMGGDLTVESTPGVGSTFTLLLPAA